jgi:hypothetical protein
MKYIILMAFSVFFCTTYSQDQKVQEKRSPKIPKDSLYQANIKKSNLYGVYIPRDVDDALQKLMELTTEEARNPLKTIHEDSIARKLFFGLGRWMEYNWNLTEGSRFSHYLRLKGITHPDDQVRLMLVLFHRHISNKPLDADNLLNKIAQERALKVKKEIEATTIKTIQNE